MSWLEISAEREAQGESGGHQWPPTTDAAWRGAVPHHRRNFPMVEAWLYAGGLIFLGKLGSTATAEVLRPTLYCGQGVWWKDRKPPLAQQRCCAPIVRTLWP